jgi:hypothetical protein
MELLDTQLVIRVLFIGLKQCVYFSTLRSLFLTMTLRNSG